MTPNIAVIIPSKNSKNLTSCLSSLDRFQPDAHVVIVWDRQEGLPNPEYFQVQYIEGLNPFCFSRNVNLGIQAAGARDGYVLLNDDAILQTPGGFNLLYWAAREHPEFGIVSAVMNHVGNLNQQPQNIGLREDQRMVCFVAVYIPQSTIDKVGLLDERYAGYGLEDDDYCLRIRQAGLKIGIHDGCVVDHGTLKSSFRADTNAMDFKPNMKRFIEKWGHDNKGLGKEESPWRDLWPD